MTWILLFLLLWMAFRMILSLGRAESAENPPIFRATSAPIANGGLPKPWTDGADG